MAAVDVEESLGGRVLTALADASPSEQLTYREAQQIIALVESKAIDTADTASLQVRTFDELARLPDSEASWIVYRFLARTAITDLSAFIKSGKSTLSAQLVTAICQGTEFLDEYPGEQGAVVLLTEEPPATLLEAFNDTGLTTKDPLHIVLWTENDQVLWEDAVASAVNYCAKVSAKTLVVDTLSQWAAVDDENDAVQARKAMNPLLQAAATGLSVLMIRQSRKDGGQIHNAARGSSAFSGAASILLHLDYVRDEKGHYDDNSTLRFLTIKSRLEREQAPPMKLDYKDGRYHLDAPKLRILGGPTVGERILNHLAAAGGAAPGDLAAALHLNRSGVRKELIRLRNKNQVRIELDGTYALEGVRHTPAATPAAPAAYPHPPHPHHPPKGGDEGIAAGVAPAAPNGSTPQVQTEFPCTVCGSLIWVAGPEGPPQRKCLGCRWVWTP